MSQNPANSLQQIGKIVRELESNGKPFEMSDLFSAAKDKNISISWKEMHFLASRYSREIPIIPPPQVNSFLNHYFSSKVFDRLLDPQAGFGILLTTLMKNGVAKNGCGIVKSHEALKLAKIIGEGENIQWMIGDSSISDKTKTFNLIVSFPQFGTKKTNYEFVSKKGTINVMDEEKYLSILKSCLLLEENGEGIFFVSNSFFFKNDYPTVYSIFPKFDLNVKAVISFLDVLTPWTAIDLNLIIVNRKKSDQMFVARMDPNSDPKPIIENLKLLKQGRVPELGRLVKHSDFSSWRNLSWSEEIQEITDSCGMQAHILSDIATMVTLGDHTEDGGFEAKKNAFYLPLIGTSPSVTDLQDLRIKPQNCAQIVLDHKFALADYVAGYFNTPLGRKIRRRLCSGVAIQKITKHDLLNNPNAKIFLPPLDIQMDIVKTHNSIRELNLKLNEYEKALWSRPFDAPKVHKEITSLEFFKKKGFESWMEGLPFPLSSILWRYHTDAELFLKNTHLLNFFEALAQFTTTLMFSAFHSDEYFFENNINKLFPHPDDPKALSRSTFGNWVIIGERLAKFTRRMLFDKDTSVRAHCLSLYHQDGAEFIEDISSKDLYAILNTVSKYRNDWKGHGGAPSDREEKRRLNLLEMELTRVHKTLANTFDESILIMPGKSEYDDGIYHYVASKLMGAHSIFPQVEVQISIPMEKDKIYLLDQSTRNPLEILPFFRMMSSPKAEADVCYFYNRLEKDGIRWISYYFEKEPELIKHDETIIKIIEKISAAKMNSQL